MSNQNQNQVDFIGSVFQDEYNGQMIGYTLMVSIDELREAVKKADHNAKVRIRIRTGKNSGKPYASVVDKSMAPIKEEEAPTPKATPVKQSAAAGDDLPF
jgi:hypothetical protein